jgi:two-component system sensor histidine kinase KdpD
VRAFPLRVGSRSIGVLTVVQKPNVHPDDDQERLLATFANSVALALEQERLAVEEQEAAVVRESDRLKSVLLSSVSHDLRTPLAGIKAAIGSLLRRDVQWNEEDRQAFLRDIDSEADRLTRLVSNLLDLSRIEAGAIRPRKEWENVRELISRVVGRLGSQLGDHRVMIDGPDEMPLVRLDAVKIEQVLTNLIENAAKYSPPGAPITVRSSLTDETDNVSILNISVADRGPGIEPAEQTNIFEKFYRVTDAKRPISGTGMGLAIVKGLVEAHGGHVVVESAPRQGSTFTLVLPVERGEAVTSASGRKRQPS